MITRSELLSAIRRVNAITKNPFTGYVQTDNEQLLLQAGVLPVRILRDFLKREHNLPDREWEQFRTTVLDKLVVWNKIFMSDDFIAPNPHERRRLIASDKEIEVKHYRRGQSYKTAYNIKGQNRNLLQYVTATADYSASYGEARGIERLCDFFRQKNVQRIFRRWMKDNLYNINWRLPEDAR